MVPFKLASSFLPGRDGTFNAALAVATEEDRVMSLIDRLFRRGRGHDEPSHGPHPGHGGHDQRREHASHEHEARLGHAEHEGHGHAGGERWGHEGHHH